MKIATAAYPPELLANWQAYADKQTAWVAEAAGQGAELLVFPEYARMELAALDGADVAADLEAGDHEAGDLEASLRAASRWSEQADRLAGKHAQTYGVTILSGSGPVFDQGAARPVNRVWLAGPDGEHRYQDKQVMTRYERDVLNVVPGEPLAVFDTPAGRIGILICYDAEFPLLGRALVEQGVEIILVPSCTGAFAGYTRVRIGAMARALESQCIVVQSPTVGAAPWCRVIDENIGAAAVYGPPDLGFPPSGVIAEGVLNKPGWTYADVDLASVSRVRTEGAVFNHAHWPESRIRAGLFSDRGDLP